jgi:hypothetical protein
VRKYILPPGKNEKSTAVEKARQRFFLLGVYESFSPKANVQGWNATFLPVEWQHQPVIFK